MSYIEKFKNLNIPITLEVLYLGWDGLGKMGRLISFEELCDTIIENNFFSKLNQPSQKIVLEIVNSEEDSEIIQKNLVNLIEINGIILLKGLKYWTAVIYNDLVNDQYYLSEPLNFIVEILDIWYMLEIVDFEPEFITKAKFFNERYLYSKTELEILLKMIILWIDEIKNQTI